MLKGPTWALSIANAVRYMELRPWQPRHLPLPTPEPLHRRVARLTKQWRASRFGDADQIVDHVERLLFAAIAECGTRRVPSVRMAQALIELAAELAIQNEIIFAAPVVDFSRSLTADEVEHITRRLSQIQVKLDNEERVYQLFSQYLAHIYLALLQHILPDAAFQER